MNSVKLLINSLPKDAHECIQTYFEIKDATNYSMTCKAFNEMLNWKMLLPEIQFPDGIEIKQYLKENIVLSFNHILKRIEKFANKLILGQQGTFTCDFPLDPSYRFQIKLSSTGKIRILSFCVGSMKAYPRQSDDLNETYLFAKRINCLDTENVKSHKIFNFKTFPNKFMTQVLKSQTEYETDGLVPKNFEFEKHVDLVIDEIAEKQLAMKNFLSEKAIPYGRIFVIAALVTTVAYLVNTIAIRIGLWGE